MWPMVAGIKQDQSKAGDKARQKLRITPALFEMDSAPFDKGSPPPPPSPPHTDRRQKSMNQCLLILLATLSCVSIRSIFRLHEKGNPSIA